ncbi:MAG TPA: oligosaccharide flippase family protein [Gaiellaceae bacterium]
MGLLQQMKRLAKHSAIYGLGGLVQRIVAVLLLPLYTRYLSPSDYGAIEALVGLSAIIFALLRAGIQSSFFRFYFDSDDERRRLTIVRTSFWFTMGTASAALLAGLVFAGPIAHALYGSTEHVNLVRAAFVGLWASMNYDQLTALFRVEERSASYAVASLTNVTLTIGATILLVVVFDKGPLGVLVGNFTGTLAVYVVLLAYRRAQLGLEFDRQVFRRMTEFGMPFVPSVIALSAIDFSDRFFIVRLRDQHELGLYAIGVRISAALIFLLGAFRTAWPAFAYSIRDVREARRTYGFVLTYVMFGASWGALALGLGSPWLVRLLTTPDFYAGSRVVAPLAFSAVIFGAYIVVVTSIGRAGRRGSNWIVTGAAALLNVVLNIVLIPPYGMMGAAVSTVVAYAAMFAGIAWKAQRVFPVDYQWRRVGLAVGTAVALTVVGKVVDVGLPGAVALTLAYPFVLALVGFYLPQERARIGAFGKRLLPGRV